MTKIDTAASSNIKLQSFSIHKKHEASESTEALQAKIKDCHAQKRNSLDLSCMGMQVLPEELKQETQLVTLDISRNRLKKLPDWIGNLPKLENLIFNSNDIDSLPASIGKLTNLKVLDARHNKLSSFPASIIELRKICYLHLNANQLTSLEMINNFPELLYVNARSNAIEILPDSVDNLGKLEELNLEGNERLKSDENIRKIQNIKYTLPSCTIFTDKVKNEEINQDDF